MSRFINPVPQFFLDDGTVASSGRIKFFVNKDYSTLKDTYSQSNNTVENTNPVKLDGQGRMPPCFGEGLYSVKFYEYDPNEVDGLGALQWTRDDVSISQLTGQFSDWSGVIPYSLGDIVKASNGDYYQSTKNSNSGNNPTLSPVFWSKIVFITEYNENETYDTGDIVSSGGYLYRSNTGGNIGHTPPSAEWDNLTFNNSVAGNFSVGGNLTVVGTINGGTVVKTTDAGVTKTAKKVVQTTRAVTITLAQDPELIVTGLEAATYYKVKAYISWDGNGSTTNGIKLRIAGSSATVISSIYIANTNTSSVNADPTANESGGVPGGFSKLPNFAASTEVILIEAVVLTTLASNIYVEWSQAASVATATRVNVGSNLIVTKL